MFTEDDLLPLSGLQHLAFCERQWALIHIEGIWEENPLTVEGRHLHERTHGTETEVRGDVRIVRGLRLRSLRLGLSGMADVVEFHRVGDADDPASGTALEGVPGRWRPVPVEYKRGRPKRGPCDEVQLCAQALCLEETFGVGIGLGYLYYGRTHHRHEVALDDALRTETERLAVHMHALFKAGVTPKARYEKKCDRCSLIEQCLPKATGGRKSARAYVRRVLAAMAEGDEGDAV